MSVCESVATVLKSGAIYTWRSLKTSARSNVWIPASIVDWFVIADCATFGEPDVVNDFVPWFAVRFTPAISMADLPSDIEDKPEPEIVTDWLLPAIVIVALDKSISVS